MVFDEPGDKGMPRIDAKQLILDAAANHRRRLREGVPAVASAKVAREIDESTRLQVAEWANEGKLPLEDQVAFATSEIYQYFCKLLSIAGNPADEEGLVKFARSASETEEQRMIRGNNITLDGLTEDQRNEIRSGITNRLEGAFAEIYERMLEEGVVPQKDSASEDRWESFQKSLAYMLGLYVFPHRHED